MHLNLDSNIRVFLQKILLICINLINNCSLLINRYSKEKDYLIIELQKMSLIVD